MYPALSLGIAATEMEVIRPTCQIHGWKGQKGLAFKSMADVFFCNASSED
jgi:hypothetical protein